MSLYLCAAVYSLAVTFVLLKILDRIMGLRVKDEHEVMGLDLSLQEENAYTVLD